MKIAIIGYGKMGRMIEKIAIERGHEISCRIDKDNISDFDSAAFAGSDAAIEFSTPATAVGNMEQCFRHGVPVVCGTTGWLQKQKEVEAECEKAGGTLMHATNFSIGVNIFRRLNSCLAKMMEKFPQYTPSMTEVHHIHKLDHPSGTAITLADDIIKADSRVNAWADAENAPADTSLLPIASERRGEVPGIHTIEWDSNVDTITITHSAKSREGFALGAVMAAEWLAGRKGVCTIDDMFGDILNI